MPTESKTKFPFKECSAILLFSDDAQYEPDPNFLYCAGESIDGSILVWKKDEKILITSKMNASKAERIFDGSVFAIDWKDAGSTIKKLIPRGKVGLDFGNLRTQGYLRLLKMFGKGRIVDISSKLNDLRRVKAQKEIEKIASAVKISKKILGELQLSPKMSEIDVVNSLILACAKEGVVPAFPPIVAAGINSKEPHHKPTQKKLGNGLVLIDFGVRYKHYNADLTRCYFLGSCKEEKKAYEQAKSIQHEIIDNMPSFHTGGQLAQFAQNACKKAGWGKMIHSIGHGLGLEVHDPPSLGFSSKDKLEDGVVLAIEPGWYGKKFGVRFENDVVWGKRKAKVL